MFLKLLDSLETSVNTGTDFGTKVGGLFHIELSGNLPATFFRTKMPEFEVLSLEDLEMGAAIFAWRSHGQRARVVQSMGSETGHVEQ